MEGLLPREEMVLRGHRAFVLQVMFDHANAGGFNGAPPAVDLDAERKNGEHVRELVRSGAVTSVHDLSDRK